jgi:hypothetical protein
MSVHDLISTNDLVTETVCIKCKNENKFMKKINKNFPSFLNSYFVSTIKRLIE